MNINQSTYNQLYAELWKKYEASQRLCEIYFEIASQAIGEDKVRELRNQMIAHKVYGGLGL